MDSEINIFISILIFVLLTLGGNVFYLLVECITKLANEKNTTNQVKNISEKNTILFKLLNSSAFIGYFERIIMYVLITQGAEQIKTVSLLVAIKGLIRYPEISTKNNEDDNSSKISAEKFLLGTMCSIVTVITVIWISVIISK